MGARNQQEKWPKECAEPEKAFSQEAEARGIQFESINSREPLTGRINKDSPKSVLHNISFVVRRWVCVPKVRPEYDSV